MPVGVELPYWWGDRECAGTAYHADCHDACWQAYQTSTILRSGRLPQSEMAAPGYDGNPLLMWTSATFDQIPGEIISVERWDADDEFPIFPTGHKAKRALICPNPAPHRFLLGGHRYLFKEPEGYASQQIWSEVLAYKLSRRLPIEVPPAFLAVDRRSGRPGVLIEFFYGHGQRASTRFVHASDRFQALGMPFDTNRGSLRDNIRLSRLHGVRNAVAWWGKTVAFDTLIGNTDRHSQNWGFLVDREEGQPPKHTLAPAFDNGSSLNFVIGDTHVPARLRPDELDKLILRGRHHYTWADADPDEVRGYDRLSRRFIEQHAGAAADILPLAALSDAQLRDVVAECSSFGDFPVPFTADRAIFVEKQIIARRALLRACLGG